MRYRVLSILVLSIALRWVLRADTVDLSKTLQGIEDHYNHAQTMQLNFAETWTLNGRKRTGSGTLYLRKPGKMRWEYSLPAGQLFVSDGEFMYSYLPAEKRAEKVKMKAVEDMGAPLAFLLGRLNFHDDFREFRAAPQADGVWITAIPKSDKFPYSEVSFLTGPDFVIRQLRVKLQDNSVLEYTFENEKRNPPIPDSTFRFSPPPGTEYVDSSRQ